MIQNNRLAVYLTAFFVCAGTLVLAQNQQLPNVDLGELHGNFDVRAQYYQEDDAIGAPEVPEQMLFNGFGNLTFTRGKFSAGLRYETYNNVLLGFSPDYQGQGITYRFVQYTDENLDVTLGNFYEQFGSGQILRAYEEPALGIDNSIDGARLRYKLKGIYFKGLVGQQRWYFQKGPGIVRAGDVEIQLNELVEDAFPSTFITIGGSVVSKYQEDDNVNLVLPENTLAYGGRFNVLHKGFNIGGEYTFKFNDPSADNGFIYQNGQMLQVTTGYTRKGFGFTLTAHTLSNMFFRSDRNNNSQFQDLFINFVPALTKQHTYNLMATLYPYATQPAGEIAIQADLIYKIKKGTALGGKYGTTITVNYAFASAEDTTSLNDQEGRNLGFEANLFELGRDEDGNVEQYFGDFNIEISRKINKKWSTKVVYQNLLYNKEVLEGKPDEADVIANVGVVEVMHKVNRKNAIRAEVQGLFTEQDQGNWGTLLLEYTYSPHWFVSVMDQWNFGNEDPDKRIHYLIGTVGYIKNATRITAGYGRQREGIFCVGGVCRVVPASNGLTLSVTTSF